MISTADSADMVENLYNLGVFWGNFGWQEVTTVAKVALLVDHRVSVTAKQTHPRTLENLFRNSFIVFRLIKQMFYAHV